MFTPVARDPSDVGRYFRIAEVGLGSDGYVTLHNFTDQPASLETLYVCQAAGCVDLPAHVVAPGAIARVALGAGAGLSDVAMRDARLDLPPVDGEVALTSSTDLDDLRRLHAYVEWGSTPHAMTARAIGASLWLPGSFAPSAPGATRLYVTENGLWLFE